MTRRALILVWLAAVFALGSRVAYHFGELAGEVTSILALVAGVACLIMFVRQFGHKEPRES